MSKCIKISANMLVLVEELFEKLLQYVAVFCQIYFRFVLLCFCSYFLQLAPYEVTLMGDVEARLTNVLQELNVIPVPEPVSVSTSQNPALFVRSFE